MDIYWYDTRDGIGGSYQQGHWNLYSSSDFGSPPPPKKKGEKNTMTGHAF